MKYSNASQKRNEIKIDYSKKSKFLFILILASAACSLVFIGGALSISFNNGGLMGGSSAMGNSWSGGISWMWVPAGLFLALAIMIAYFRSQNKQVNKHKT